MRACVRACLLAFVCQLAARMSVCKRGFVVVVMVVVAGTIRTQLKKKWIHGENRERGTKQ